MPSRVFWELRHIHLFSHLPNSHCFGLRCVHADLAAGLLSHLPRIVCLERELLACAVTGNNQNQTAKAEAQTSQLLCPKLEQFLGTFMLVIASKKLMKGPENEAFQFKQCDTQGPVVNLKQRQAEFNQN